MSYIMADSDKSFFNIQKSAQVSRVDTFATRVCTFLILFIFWLFRLGFSVEYRLQRNSPQYAHNSLG